MTDYEKQRLSRYIQDAKEWLMVIEQMLYNAETPSQVAASDFARGAGELVKAARRQLVLDGTIQDEIV